MSDFEIILKNFDFSGDAVKLALTWEVGRLTRNIFIGPEKATLIAYGNLETAGQLANRVGCPIEVLYTPIGEVVWSGYIESVDIPAGDLNLSVSITNMINRAATAYSFVASGSSQVGQRETTAWVQDDDSIARWGTWEMLYSTSGASTAEAEAVRDAIIAMYKNPQASYQTGYGNGGIVVECAGWGVQLDRRYYTNSGVSDVETTNQIAAIITSIGRPLTGTRIVDASGITRSEHRNGDNTALYYINEMLTSGTDTGERLNGIITKDRIFEIRKEPAKGVSDYLRRPGRLEDAYGRRIETVYCPVGVWIRTVDVMPASISGVLINDPTYGFVEAATWTPGYGYEPVMRGMPSASDLAKNIIEEG